MKTCFIGVQARSTSSRLPDKCLMKINDRTMIDHILGNCFKTMKYMNKHAEKSGIYVNYALLVPTGDKIVDLFKGKCLVIEGDEIDVLSRYVKLQKETNSDYIVRLTADCPMMKTAIITKHINVAFRNDYDYVANCFEEFRTFVDGHDVEVVSQKALDWLNTNSRGVEREHVTIKFRTNPPSWAKIGVVMESSDETDVKLSVDTQDDFNRVKSKMELGMKKRNMAVKRFGRRNVFNF